MANCLQGTQALLNALITKTTASNKRLQEGFLVAVSPKQGKWVANVSER